ncbi:coiled-coil domain-containing protein R3HCC1L isoform X2 [Prorops nasuta]|uniref:coiled-coil domain-containing protein R3HCC1L isoform X2 n=1 Tax=Prorops nasuta TaxID=863751 RepID=UPI0034CF0F4E
MSLQDSLFSEDVENDVIEFSKDEIRKRDPKTNGTSYKNAEETDEVKCTKSAQNTVSIMGVEGRRSSSTSASTSASPEHSRPQRQVKSTPAVEIYRPPAARKATQNVQISVEPAQPQSDSSSIKNSNRRRRPDRAVYVPRHRRSLEVEESLKSSEPSRSKPAVSDQLKYAFNDNASLLTSPPNDYAKEESNAEHDSCKSIDPRSLSIINFDSYSNNTAEVQCEDKYEENLEYTSKLLITNESLNSNKVHASNYEACTSMYADVSQVTEDCTNKCDRLEIATVESIENDKESNQVSNKSEDTIYLDDLKPCSFSQVSNDKKYIESIHNFMHKANDHNSDNALICSWDKRNDDASVVNQDDIINEEERLQTRQKIPEVIRISDKEPSKVKSNQDTPTPLTPPEKKVKKVERPKSKPASPPAPLVKINRDECDWDSLFDDNGDCLDPTMMEELTSAVGEVTIEQPKNTYKAYTKQIEVSSDEFAHVVEIYNFPSDFKTSDLAAVFSPFKNGGFELKWVDDTHCLGVFSSPLIAAEVLASNHPFVKTRPLRDATALSKSKARRSAEFLQPYRSRPETCAALARRLVTGALGVRLATARQERELEKNVLREAKEKRKLANKQREDAWEGIIPQK